MNFHDSSTKPYSHTYMPGHLTFMEWKHSQMINTGVFYVDFNTTRASPHNRKLSQHAKVQTNNADKNNPTYIKKKLSNAPWRISRHSSLTIRNRDHCASNKRAPDRRPTTQQNARARANRIELRSNSVKSSHTSWSSLTSQTKYAC